LESCCRSATAAAATHSGGSCAATAAAAAAPGGGSGGGSGSLPDVEVEVDFSGFGICSGIDAEEGEGSDLRSGSAARPATAAGAAAAAAAPSGGSGAATAAAAAAVVPSGGSGLDSGSRDADDVEIDFSGVGDEAEEGEGVSELGMALFKTWARCANEQQLIEAEAKFADFLKKHPAFNPRSKEFQLAWIEHDVHVGGQAIREFLACKKVGVHAIKSLTKRVIELSREAGHRDEITFDEDVNLGFEDSKVQRCYTSIHLGNENRWAWFTEYWSLVKDGENAKAADHIRNIKSASRTRLFRKLKVINPNAKKKNKRKASDGDEIGNVKKRAKNNSHLDDEEEEEEEEEERNQDEEEGGEGMILDGEGDDDDDDDDESPTTKRGGNSNAKHSKLHEAAAVERDEARRDELISTAQTLLAQVSKLKPLPPSSVVVVPGATSVKIQTSNVVFQAFWRRSSFVTSPAKFEFILLG
jgi:hypothetical protein